MATAARLPTIAEEPFSAETLTDAYPFFARLRDAGPVVWLNRYGIYAKGRHAEKRRACIRRRDPPRIAGGSGASKRSA